MRRSRWGHSRALSIGEERRRALLSGRRCLVKDLVDVAKARWRCCHCRACGGAVGADGRRQHASTPPPPPTRACRLPRRRESSTAQMRLPQRRRGQRAPPIAMQEVVMKQLPRWQHVEWRPPARRLPRRLAPRATPPPIRMHLPSPPHLPRRATRAARRRLRLHRFAAAALARRRPSPPASRWAPPMPQPLRPRQLSPPEATVLPPHRCCRKR